MVYYSLDNPHLVYDYDCAANIPTYDGYIEDGHTFDGYTYEAHVGRGYYDDAYIYANWRLW